MGAVDVETDAPSLPLLSGATSRTWVEHGVPGGPAPSSWRPASARATGPTSAPAWCAPGLPPDHHTRARRGAEPPVAAAPNRRRSRPPAGADPAPAPSGGAALLDLVTGGDWMDDSIGLAAPGSLLDEAADAGAGTRAAPPIVEGRHGPRAPLPLRPSQPAESSDLSALRRPRRPRRADRRRPPAGPRRLVGDDGDHDPRSPGRSSSAAAPIRPPPASTTTPNGSCCPSGAGVSRTHLVVSADGWTITATDCGSRRGTELARPGAAPVRLEPWTSHEVQVGDELFLGGPTSIRSSS